MSNPLNYVIAGGSGFLGEALAAKWSARGINVTILTRGQSKRQGAISFIHWDAATQGDWTSVLEDADLLLNLVGKSVDCRYNEKNKKEIINSRMNSTHALAEAMRQVENSPRIWLNASSATIYRHAEDRSMTESNGEIGDDFSMNVVKDWEELFLNAELPNVRKASLRTSIVLGNKGGAFPKMKSMTKLGLGGRQGNGKQMVSWIHIDDFCAAIDFIIDHDSCNAEVNVTAPIPVMNREFMKTLRNNLSMPLGLPAPKLILELGAFFLQTETELLLKSRWVLPEKLVQAGFKFKYRHPEAALKELCTS